MPGDEHPLVAALVVTCEHASHWLPARYGTLGLTRAQFTSHIGWDAGAQSVARALAGHWRCPLHLGRYSRLLVDLNRSESHPRWIARRSFGVIIPGNLDLPAAERRLRRERYWLPYRRAVFADIEALLARAGRVIHWSVHSFYPRGADVGLLYDPARSLERDVVGAARSALVRAGFSVRRNFPYRGTSDGLTTHCRTLFPDPAYAGIELEINQRLLSVPGALRRLAAALVLFASAAPGSEKPNEQPAERYQQAPPPNPGVHLP